MINMTLSPLNQSSLLVTGATGFVGSRLCEVAAQGARSVRRAVKKVKKGERR